MNTFTNLTLRLRSHKTLAALRVTTSSLVRSTPHQWRHPERSGAEGVTESKDGALDRLDILFISCSMNCRIELEQEVDGRWIAEVTDIPGVLVYGKSRHEAMLKAQALALRVLAERIDLGEVASMPLTISFLAA